MGENTGYANFISDKPISTLGFWAGLAAFIAIISFGIVQVLQVLGLLVYPLDEILIYGCSLCITIPFLLAMLALHHITRQDRKFWSHTAVVFTILYVVFAAQNYVVQLATVIPMTARGMAGSIAVLRQTPHSLFWDFDAMGYIAMGLASLFAVPVFEKRGFQRWVRYTFLVHGLITPLIAWVYFYPAFSTGLLLVAAPWAITAPLSMLLLCLLFKKNVEAKTDHADV